jgi:GrpB-like predicted nucleotidyltransferase (UPF0157 family)
MFRTPDRSVHLHVWRDGSDGQIGQLVFRDWLRAHGDDLARYEAVKRELAARQWGSMGDYADAKSDVVADIMERAEAGGTDVSTERRSNS